MAVSISILLDLFNLFIFYLLPLYIFIELELAARLSNV
jgi:hypothetical protein